MFFLIHVRPPSNVCLDAPILPANLSHTRHRLNQHLICFWLAPSCLGLSGPGVGGQTVVGGPGASGGGGGWPSDTGVPLSHVDYPNPEGDMGGAVGVNGAMPRDEGRRGAVDSSGGSGGLDMGMMRPFDPMHGMGDGRESSPGPFHGMGAAEVSSTSGAPGGGVIQSSGGANAVHGGGGRPLSPLMSAALGGSSGSSPPGLARLGSGINAAAGSEASNGLGGALQQGTSAPSPSLHKPGRKSPSFDPISGNPTAAEDGGRGGPGSAAQGGVDTRGSGSIDGSQSKEGSGSGGGGVAPTASGDGSGGGGEVSKTSMKPQENGGGGGGLVRGEGGGGRNNDDGEGDEARKRLRIEELLH